MNQRRKTIMITIVRVEEHTDRINQMLASTAGNDTIVIIRAAQHAIITDQATSSNTTARFSREIDEEELITWEDAEWQ
jgi:hypothetical protein